MQWPVSLPNVFICICIYICICICIDICICILEDRPACSTMEDRPHTMQWPVSLPNGASGKGKTLMFLTTRLTT